MDLLGAQVVDGRVAADEVAVERLALGQPAQAGLFRRPAGREELGGEEVAVAAEGRADGVADDAGQLGPPLRLAVPARRPGVGGERIRPERRGQVLVDLVEGALDVDAGRRPPGGQPGPEAVDRLVEQPRQLPLALHQRPGRLRRRGLDLGGGDQELGVDAGHLVEAQLRLPDVDGLHRSGQLGPQQLLRHPPGGVEAGGVDGVDGRPQLQPRRPLAGLAFGGDVLDAVVVAMVTVERGLGRPELEVGLPVAVGQPAQVGSAASSSSSGHSSGRPCPLRRGRQPPRRRTGPGWSSRPAPVRRRRGRRWPGRTGGSRRTRCGPTAATGGPIR